MQCDALKAKGAKVASSPAEVISNCSITYGMLADPAGALAVVKGENGIASAMTSGKSYVDVSTVDEQTSQKISKLITSAGGRFLEVRPLWPDQPCMNI